MMLRRRYSIFAMLLALAASYFSDAQAQKITSVSSMIRPRGSDDITIHGLIPKEALNAITTFGVEVAPFGYLITKSSLKISKDKRTLFGTFKPRGGGIRSAKIDTKSGKYTFVISGVALSTAPTPRRIRVSTEATDSCADFILVPVPNDGGSLSKARALQAAKYGKLKSPQKFASKGSGFACSDNSLAASVSPITVPPKTSNTLEFRVNLPRGSAASLNVFRQGSRGSAVGDAICTLLPDGVIAGLHKCSAIVQSGTPGVLTFLVTGSIGSANQSQSLQVSIAAPLSGAEIKKITALETTLEASYGKVLQAFGNTPDAKTALISELRKSPLVREAGVSPNNTDVYFVLTNGIQGGFLLSLRDEKLSLQSSPLPPRTAARIERTNRMTYARAGENQSPRVFVYDPRYFDESEGVTVRPIFQLAQEPAFALDYRVDLNSIDVDMFKEMSGAGTAIITTHGLILKTPDIWIFSKEQSSEASKTKHAADLQAGNLAIIPTNLGTIFAMSPSFVRKYLSFPPGAIIFAGLCHSAENETMSSAFREKGASTYYGFTDTVASEYAAKTAVATFCSLLVERETTGIAFDDVEPKIDPIDSHHAEFQIHGDTEIEYQGSKEPKIQLSTKKLKYFPAKNNTFSVQALFGEEGDLSCILYDWKTSGKIGGILSQGQRVNELRTDQSKVDFAFNEDVVFGKDTIQVDFLRKTTEQKISSETIEVEPYCPIDTTVSYLVKTSAGLNVETNRYEMKNDEIGTVTWVAPGAEVCKLEHFWSHKSDRSCVYLESERDENADPDKVPDTKYRIEVKDCFKGYAPATEHKFSVTHQLYGDNPETEETVNLNSSKTLEFVVKNPCVVEVSGGVLKEVCCSDKDDNDGDKKVDCEDPDCSEDKSCAADEYLTKPELFVSAFPSVYSGDPTGAYLSFSTARWPQSRFPGSKAGSDTWCVSLERINPPGQTVLDTAQTQRIPKYPLEYEYTTLGANPNTYHWEYVRKGGAFFDIFLISEGSNVDYEKITTDRHNLRKDWVFHIRKRPVGGCRKTL